jgi:hypothetical protein
MVVFNWTRVVSIDFDLPEWIHLDVVGRLTPSKNGN